MTNNSKGERRDGFETKREERRREMRAMPGEILRDFFSTVGFWAAMILCWGLITGAGAAIGYAVGGDRDGLWLGAAIVGGASPILMGFALALDIPRKMWRKIRGRRDRHL